MTLGKKHQYEDNSTQILITVLKIYGLKRINDNN